MEKFLDRYKVYWENKKISKKYKKGKTKIYEVIRKEEKDKKKEKFKGERKKIKIIEGNYLDYIYRIDSEKNQNIGLLNNANLYFVGGGYRFGQIAQEESLCYVSNLYSELNKVKKHYYKNWLKFGMYNSNIMFYTEGVTFFRDKKLKILNEEKNKKIDIVTASAVNRKFMIIKNERKINEIMLRRIRMIIKIFIENGNKTIILSPFGCGAYGNELKTVAELFKKVLIKEEKIDFFDQIIFFCYKKEEYVVFDEVFLKKTN